MLFLIYIAKVIKARDLLCIRVKLEIAKKMKMDNFPLQSIITYTELTEEEINNLNN